ncbi:MAG: DegT/DnrJ/EryC1/StrS aminotransferase family protein [Leptospiraceae bacterium]|nr:DegT/DnrJ/EryC1/StrS aminotransferase family protein [Leptospiraceae bacterium]
MHNNITREDLDTVIRFLQGEPILTQSTNVKEFEREWSEWCGVKYSVYLNSGSSANQLTMLALKILYGEGEVIVPTLTWVSDIAAVIQNGFKPVFVDINPDNLCMDTKEVISKLNSNTKAVFMTYVQGFNGLTDELLNVLKEKNIPLIEDVCEAHGATFKGQRLGSFGLVSNFSYYYAHHMSTIEGGMVCTNDEKIYQILRMCRSHGMVREMTDENMKNEYKSKFPDLNPDFIFAYPAYNMRNSEIGAVIGRNQLKRLDDNNVKRNENYRYFLSNLDSQKYKTNFDLEGMSNYAFNLVLNNPDMDFCNRVMNALREAKVEFRRGSAGGGNQTRQPYLKGIIPDKHYENFPKVDHIHFYGFYIGNFPDLERDKIKSLCDLLNSI